MNEQTTDMYKPVGLCSTSLDDTACPLFTCDAAHDDNLALARLLQQGVGGLAGVEHSVEICVHHISPEHIRVHGIRELSE